MAEPEDRSQTAPHPAGEPDRLDAIGILLRREIEAKIVGPLLDALGEEFGRQQVLEAAGRVITAIARQQGAQLAVSAGGCSLAHYAASLGLWKKGDAMQMELLEQSETVLSYNITRCRYAEMYQELGMGELGSILSCSRDQAFIEGFNPDIQLTRTQTLMEGAPYCDFRFRHK
jgi:hypothetical protein